MKYRVLICGSRNYNELSSVREFLARNIDSIECIIEGGARGADRCARMAAESLGIPVITFEADWKQYGKRAGPIRNQLMLDAGNPHYVLAYPMPDSIGTWDMMKRAEKAGVPVKNMTNATKK
jgi:hypothetical protein